MTPELTIESPKRKGASLGGWADLFPYYAGYPEEFAKRVLSSANLRRGAKIYDPWNGSGSTTSAAASLGFNAHGSDINPVMVIVARARLLPASEWSVLRPLSRRIIQHARSLVTPAAEDPLGQWFCEATVARMRRLEQSVREHLVESEATPVDAAELSALASTFYVALFSATRKLASSFRSSNPTWLKIAKEPEHLLSHSRIDVERCFLEAVERARSSCRATSISAKRGDRVKLHVADSTVVRPRRGTIDFVLTSPPYCTRIDYTSATRVELAILAPMIGDDRQALSAKMLGSVRVPREYPLQKLEWGQTAAELLAAVRQHKSHASDTYYLKSHLDYFSKLYGALGKCTEALRPGGRMLLVVQDSRYKGVHVDLQAITTEMCSALGLTAVQRRDFEFGRSMRDVNSRAKAYGATGAVTESALVFQKAA